MATAPYRGAIERAYDNLTDDELERSIAVGWGQVAAAREVLNNHKALVEAMTRVRNARIAGHGYRP